MEPTLSKKPPAVYLYGLLVSGGWLFGWPVLYATFDAALKNAPAFIWLTHAAAVLWFFSLIAFFGTLAFLKDYSPTLSFIWEGLTFLIEILSIFV